MGFLLTLFTSALLIVAGALALVYNFQLTRIFGYQVYAEQYLGSGGTYTMWKLIGIFLMLGGIWYLFH